MRATLLVLVGLALAGSAAEKKPALTFTAEQVAFYEKQVLPILKEHCYKCHGGKKVRGGLRIDSHAALTKGGDLGPAVIAGKLDDSPLVKAVRYRTEGMEMPPAGKLPQAKIDVLVKWASMGLPFSPGNEGIVKEPIKRGITDKDRDWWAYRPLRRPAVPVAKSPEWGRSPVDAFLLAKLDAAGLKPAPPADRVALARRLYYDLTGLPPMPEQVDAFVSDDRPDAYERLVETLLASPGYGEKWGRHWLDLVRFAETHGYERDSAKPFAWRYRDWVVGAFNENMPYDRFVRMQLAGDEVAPGDPAALVATGYYRLGIWDDEPADKELARYDVLDGIVSTTSNVFLGMTVGCARCHDHKKDPIPQKDYYRLLAYFRDITPMNRENLRRVAGSAELARAAHKQRQAREAEAYRRQLAVEQECIAALAGKADAAALRGSDLTDLTYRYYRDAWHALPDFAPLKPVQEGKLAGNRFTLSAAPQTETMALVFDGSLRVPVPGDYAFDITASDGVRLIVDGKRVIDRPGKGKARDSAKAALRAGLLPVRLEYFNTTTKAKLSVGWSGPGFARRSLSDHAGGKVLVPDSRTVGQTWRYATAPPSVKWSEPGFDDSGWKQGLAGFGTRGTPGAVVRTVWETPAIWLRKTFTLDAMPHGLALDLHHDDDVEVFLNGKRVHQKTGYLTAYKRIVLKPEALRVGKNVLAIHCRQFAGGQYLDAGLVANAGPTLDTLVAKHLPGKARELARLRRGLARIRAQKVLEGGMPVMCVAESGHAVTRVLVRGNPHAPGDEVTAGTPEVLGPSPRIGAKGKRAALADWITDARNPTTARVMANRVWQYHFGRAIAPTSNDFGKLGEAPTHPELLDWLACELREGDWDVKRLHRAILLSSAYRMSSQGDPTALAKDGANNLFWRFPMRRLAAEEVRDSILAASGQLNRRMAGPSVFPPIPKAVLAGQSVPGSGWGKSSPAEAARRSVYVHVKRSLLVPILATHDAADTDSSCAVRFTTTVPTQALGMLNGEFTNEQADLFAGRLMAEGGTVSDQVRRAIRLTTGRVPAASEVARDAAFIARMKKAEDWDERRAMAAYCLLALNANEFVYLD